MKHLKVSLMLVALASLTMTATANSTHKHKRNKAAPEAAVMAPTGSLGPMVGTWTLRDGDKPRTDIKMKFKPNGTFAFVGPNWNSAGVYRVQDHKLRLVWTAVDGSKVAPGTMKKDYSMADDDSSFTIDKYTYYKLHD